MLSKQDFLNRNKLVQEGYLKKVISEDGKLVSYSYTNQCIWDNKWTKITKLSRGSVYELSTGKLVALAFPKFFNLSELAVSKSQNLMKKKEIEVYEKVDGSLIIIFHYNGNWHMKTRRLFNTTQSAEAKKMIKEKYTLDDVDKNFTLLTEIIYPENKIIINYDKRELILLAGYDINTQQELDRDTMVNISKKTKMPIIKSFNHTIDELIKLQDELDDQNEGFVVLFKNGERVKIKSKEYLKVAQLLAKLTPLTIWRFMKGGKVDTKPLQGLPEEFRNEINIIVEALETKYNIIKKEVLNDYDQLIAEIETELGKNVENIRKEIGLRVNKVKHKKAIFLIHFNKKDRLNDYIMKRLRPKGNESIGKI